MPTVPMRCAGVSFLKMPMSTATHPMETGRDGLVTALSTIVLRKVNGQAVAKRDAWLKPIFGLRCKRYAR
jgi:hypothetical protein